jgi:hypothetical protein
MRPCGIAKGQSRIPRVGAAMMETVTIPIPGRDPVTGKTSLPAAREEGGNLGQSRETRDCVLLL